MRTFNHVVLASTNVGKYREFEDLLKGYPGLDLVPAESVLRNAGKLAEVETHSNYLDNAVAKARLANLGCHYPALGDDSGLEVAALGGAPGVKSQRYSPTGQDRSNIDKLLIELKDKTGEERQARFVSTVALVIEGILLHSTGTWEGAIADAPRGKRGFGYDSVFIPKGMDKTVAEMSDLEKNSQSHRAFAIKDLMAQVASRGIVFAKP